MTSSGLLEALDIIGESGRVAMLEVVQLAPVWDPSQLGARCYVMFTLLGANANNLAAKASLSSAVINQCPRFANALSYRTGAGRSIWTLNEDVAP